MNRKTLMALGAFAALSLVAYLTTRQPEKGQRVGEKPRPVPRLKAGDFDTVEITRGGATTTLHKDGDKVKITAPIQYAVDDFAGKQAFEQLEKLEFGDIISDQKAKQGDYEVADAGLRVVAKKGAEVKLDVMVGKGVGPNTMIRPSGKDEIWSAVGSMKATYDKDTTAWRDKSITTYTATDAESIDIVTKSAGKISLKKQPKAEGDKSTEDNWVVVDASTKVDALDKTVPPGVASGLASFKANEFADAAKPDETGLAEPALTVTVTIKGGKKVTALVGNKKGDDEFYVKAADGPQVFVVKKYSIERIARRPIDFRDKAICSIAEADLAEVAVAGTDSWTIAKTGSDWKLTKPAGAELDTAKVSPIVNIFREWKGTSFAEDPSPKATGLVKPKATVSARSADKKTTCVVKLGDETKDKQSYYAMKAGSADVYVVPKWQADRLLKKVDDLKKTGTLAKK